MVRNLHNPRFNACGRWAVGLVVCTIAALAPQTAIATCGDYLAMPDRTSPGDSRHIDRHANPSQSPSPHIPCRGPACRRSLPPAAPSAPFSVELTTDQWACAIQASAVDTRGSDSLPALSRVSRADGHPLLIERPPR